MSSSPITLIDHITRRQRQFPQARGSFTSLMQALAVAAKIISREVNRGGIGDLLGGAGRRNVQGESVTKLDEFADDVLIEIFRRCGEVSAIGSEELAVPIRLPNTGDPAPYAVVFDPLDGSSNIDVAVPVGTIFGVYPRRSAPDGLGGEEDLVQPGNALVAAGYVLYGSSTVFVYSSGDGTHGFTLNPSLGEFVLTYPDMRIPNGGTVFSVNTANRGLWSPGVLEAVESFEQPVEGGAPSSLRYIGSLVADAHRTLLRGGIFMYPADRKSPAGKLRLLYEAAPMAFLFEQAGGAATNGTDRILDVVPSDLHQRTPLVLGAREPVERFAATVSAHANAAE